MASEHGGVHIWHNAACSKSRDTLALIRQAGIEPVIVDYLRDPPDRATLRHAVAAAGLHMHDAIRTTEPEYLQQGLDNAALDADALLDAMVTTPGLIQRPFVFAPLGVRLCRPPDVVLEILQPLVESCPSENEEIAAAQDGTRAR